jgi:hypothetical protein
MVEHMVTTSRPHIDNLSLTPECPDRPAEVQAAQVDTWTIRNVQGCQSRSLVRRCSSVKIAGKWGDAYPRVLPIRCMR